MHMHDRSRPERNMHATQEALLEILEASRCAPEHYREVIVLARIVGLPHGEIAARMERTEAATRNLLGRALTRLAEELDAPDQQG